MSRRKKSMSGITPELFSRLYMESWKAGHTVRQFADRVEMSVNLVRSRARYYRKRGVALPPLKAARAGRRHDAVPVDAMNRIVESAMQYRTTLPDGVRPVMVSANGSR